MKKRTKIILGVISGLIIIGFLGSQLDKKDKKSGESQTSVADTVTQKETEHQVGDSLALMTDYFAVWVNSISISKKINTGNEFSSVTASSGSKFLILDVTFKNIDKESRMLTDGEVVINYNNKEYKFEKTETIMAEGWGMILEELNPLTSKNTKLVYAIPEEIVGTAYYHPGRSDDDQKISLGELK